MDHHDHGDSHGPASEAAACKISMLWNWYTVDACFISEQWHIRSVGAYAGTVISVFLVVVLIELFRRLAREYDRKIVREHVLAQRSPLDRDRDSASAHKLKLKPNLADDACAGVPFRPTVAQQAVRSFFYFVQFSAGYMLMLMAMYYNGGVILAIFFGSYFGFFVSSWDTVGGLMTPETRGQTCC